MSIANIDICEAHSIDRRVAELSVIGDVTPGARASADDLKLFVFVWIIRREHCFWQGMRNTHITIMFLGFVGFAAFKWKLDCQFWNFIILDIPFFFKMLQIFPTPERPLEYLCFLVSRSKTNKQRMTHVRFGVAHPKAFARATCWTRAWWKFRFVFKTIPAERHADGVACEIQLVALVDLLLLTCVVLLTCLCLFRVPSAP